MNSGTTVTLDPSQGSWAVSHARTVVEEVVESGRKPERPTQIDPVFEIDRGAFVTLRKGGDLRGCIGRPTPEQPAIRAIRGAAVDAATDDPRFPPVRPEELSAIVTEVSVLTPPDQVEPVTPEAITVGRDGLIVSNGNRGGLLLPQVPVDQGWDAKTFLERTCRKAGLDADCWRHSGVSFERFSAQIFEEVEPQGEIVHRPIGGESSSDLYQ